MLTDRHAATERAVAGDGNADGDATDEDFDDVTQRLRGLGYVNQVRVAVTTRLRAGGRRVTRRRFQR